MASAPEKELFVCRCKRWTLQEAKDKHPTKRTHFNCAKPKFLEQASLWINRWEMSKDFAGNNSKVFFWGILLSERKAHRCFLLQYKRRKLFSAKDICPESERTALHTHACVCRTCLPAVFCDCNYILIPHPLESVSFPSDSTGLRLIDSDIHNFLNLCEAEKLIQPAWHPHFQWSFLTLSDTSVSQFNSHCESLSLGASRKKVKKNSINTPVAIYWMQGMVLRRMYFCGSFSFAKSVFRHKYCTNQRSIYPFLERFSGIGVSVRNGPAKYVRSTRTANLHKAIVKTWKGQKHKLS